MISNILKWRLKKRINRLPLYLILFVTYRCNARCLTCFYHKNIDSPPSKDLPLDFYNKVASTMDHLEWLHISGGEPFIRKDLSEIVKFFSDKTSVQRIGIPTNGLLGERILKTTKEILEDSPGIQLNIVLSLDGFQKTHDYIRGVDGNWEKTIEILKELKDLRKNNNRLSINICTVLNNRNSNEIPELLKYINNMGVDFHDIGLMRGDYRDKDLNLPPIEKVRDIFKDVNEYAHMYYSSSSLYPGRAAKRAGQVHNYLNKSYLKYLSDEKKFQPCMIGDGFAVIEPNGDVRLCELTPVIGNLTDYDSNFRLFWNSEEIRMLRKNGLCKTGGCTHSNFQTRNFLLNPCQWRRALP